MMMCQCCCRFNSFQVAISYHNFFYFSPFLFCHLYQFAYDEHEIKGTLLMIFAAPVLSFNEITISFSLKQDTSTFYDSELVCTTQILQAQVNQTIVM